MKPKPREAMLNLLLQIRDTLPISRSDIHLCKRSCNGCSKKLVQYLRAEVENWEWAIDQGEDPSLGDISRLAKTSEKIYKALKKNGVLSGSNS